MISESTDVSELALSELEFDATCDLWYKNYFHAFGLSIQISFRHDCNRPAKWIGNIPCCGDTILTCQKCYEGIGPRDLFECCGRAFPRFMITWSKI